jgi:hypothetical protein
MDTTSLTWRDKLAIVDTTARIALTMFLMLVGFSELLVIASR